MPGPDLIIFPFAPVFKVCFYTENSNTDLSALHSPSQVLSGAWHYLPQSVELFPPGAEVQRSVCLTSQYSPIDSDQLLVAFSLKTANCYELRAITRQLGHQSLSVD